jgi:hypothetical protein
MLSDYTIQFFVVLTAGVAVGFAGLANLLAPRMGRAGRIAMTAVVSALPLAGLALIQDDTKEIFVAAGFVAAVLLFVALMGTKTAIAAVGNRAVRWAGLSALGIAVVVGSSIRYDRELEADSDAQISGMDLAEFRPPLEPVSTPAVTDRGHTIAVIRPTELRPTETTRSLDERQLRASDMLMRVIRLAPADDTTNCHGWVFTGGKYWIGGKQVDLIIEENGYHAVTVPKAGDLVVYRASPAEVTHSAVVLAVPEGQAVLVESKWGCLGVFLHPIDTSPSGTDFTYYHSNRTGHVLAGMTSTHPGVTKITLP